MIKGRIDDAPTRLAAKFFEFCKGNQIPLDWSPESLKLVDRLMDGFAGRGAAGNEGLIDYIAAYYGEVVRRRVGGEWYTEIEPDGDWGLVLDAERGYVLWCAATVHKHFEQGGKSLHAIYQTVAANPSREPRSTVPPTPAPHSSPKPAAKRASRAAEEPTAPPRARRPR